jgi:hypothetical protein
MSYNGWTNWETWNIAMWIGNDEMFSRIMTLSAKGDWELFKALAMQFGITKTPDGVEFESLKVNQDELRKAFAEDQEDFDQSQDFDLVFDEEEEEECSVLEGRRLLKTRSFYI